MKKFKFRLQRVLDFRKIFKREKQRVLNEKNHALNMAKERLDFLNSCERENLIKQEQILNVAEVELSANYAARLREEIVHQRLAIIHAEDEVEKALAEYIEAAKEEKALIKLKEKKISEYREYLDVEERKALDDFTISKGQVHEELL